MENNGLNKGNKIKKAERGLDWSGREGKPRLAINGRAFINYGAFKNHLKKVLDKALKE